MNIDVARSYASEANLLKALDQTGLSQYRHIVVCNRAGRFTAIFPQSAVDGNFAGVAGSGFMVTG